MKIIYLTTFALFIWEISIAQVALNWTANINLGGATEPHGMEMDSSENTVIWGRCDTAYYISKIDSGGTQLWIKTFSFSINDLKLNSVGDIYVTGAVNQDSVNIKKAYLIKLNSAGQLQWQVNDTLGTEGYSLAFDSGDQPIVGGNNALVGPQFLIAKYNSSGSLLWNNKKNNNNYNPLYEKIIIIVTSRQNIYAIDNTGSSEVRLFKFNPSGNELWDTIIPGSIFEKINDSRNIILDSVEGIYFSYHTSLGINSNLIHFDSNGNFIFQVNLGLFSYYNQFIRKSNDGFIYIAGSSNGVHLCKFDIMGNLIWDKQYTYDNYDFVVDLQIGQDSTFYLGFERPDTIFLPISFAKCDVTGNIEWESSFNDNGLAIFGGYFTLLKLDSQQNIFAAGFLNNGKHGCHTLLQKYHEHVTGIFSLAEKNHSLKIYPNPSTDDWNISLQNLPQIKNPEIEIRNINGGLINSYNYFIHDSEIIIKNNGLMPGIYFLRIKTEQWERSEKLVLTR